MQLLASYKTAIVSMAVYAVLMAVATFIEKYSGTDAAKALVYYSPLFLFLQLLMVVNFICISIRKKLFRKGKWGYVLLHSAFIVILAGAAITHFFSKDGIMSIREGEKTSELVIKKGNGQYVTENLPFEVELLDFRLIRYPGSHSPSSYESDLRVHANGQTFDEKVYMNHVMDRDGYRFFQASYDKDERGTILSVSYDVTGRTVTYIGYALMLLGFLACLLGRQSRFRGLIRQLDKTALVLVLAFAGTVFPAQAAPAGPNLSPVPAAVAEAFGKLPMLSPQGRVIPVNTFASEIVRKLQIEDMPGGNTDNQFLLGLWLHPAEWMKVPLIYVEEKDLRAHFSNGKEFVSYVEVFDQNGDYRFEKDVEEVYQKNPSQRSRLDKEILKFDERVNLLHQLFSFRLIRLFPIPGDMEQHRWLAPGEMVEDVPVQVLAQMGQVFDGFIQAARAEQVSSADSVVAEIRDYQKQFAANEVNESRIQSEVRYNQMNILPHSRRTYLIFGALLLILSISLWFVQKEAKWMKVVKILLFAGVVAAFAFHAYNMGLRWYISGHAPWSNSYETMVLLSWAAVLGGLLFSRKSFISFALAVLLGGVVLFVSELNWMDPQITPLVPVLKSPWLMFHVAVLMVAYGFFGISCMISLTNLVALSFRNKRNQAMLEARVSRLSIINEMSLTLGLSLMMVGIFLGAIWANESWGRYWSWDPKETWALITGVVYAIVLHVRWLGKKKNDLVFNLMAQLAFLTVLMTYFGVNYLLSGMHSYGNANALSGIPVWACILSVVVFILPGVAALVTDKLRNTPGKIS